jgi:hypothetical protein
MAETTAEGQTPFDRFNEALRNLDEEIQDVRERFDRGRERVETEVRQRADRVREELRNSDVFRRVEQLRKDVEEQLQRSREQVYNAVGLATKAEVEKLNRKLNQLSRKLNELTKEV